MKLTDRFLLLTVFIFLFSVAVFAQNGKISGKVTYGDKSPLHDAAVQVTQLKRTVTTNEEGFYEITDVPAGRYTILVHLEGFTDQTKIVDVTTGANLTLDFGLQISSLKEQVTVTASGTEQSTFDSFQTVNSVGQARITEKAATSIGEVLETETGVAKRSFGVGSSRPVIRGFDGDRVLILQDGVRGGSVGSQSGDHGEPIDPLSAERIEVVKGPGTLLYGSNALGGVVNVISNDENEAHTGFRGFATAVGGTADKQGGLAGGLEYGFRNWLFRGNYSAQRSGDYNTPIGKIPNSASRSNTGGVGVGYYADKAYLSGNYNFDVRRYGIPFAALFEGGGEERPAFADQLPFVDEEIDLRQRRHNFRVNGGFRNLENSLVSGVQYNLDYSNYRHKEIETADGIDQVGTIFDNKTFSYRSLFEQNQYKQLSGRFGFEGFSREYQVNGAEQLVEGKIKQDSLSVFALEELNFERVKFQFGGRLENNRYKAENPAYLDRSFTGFSGSVGANIALWKGGALIANYTNSYRAPALEELYNHGPHIGNVTFEIGNQSLKNERANGFDFSLRHLSDRFRITGDVYYYNINDFVFLAYRDENADGDIDIEDGLPVARYEQAKARYFGAELSADVTFNKYLGGFLSLDMVRARLVDENINLPRIPPARARVGLDFRYEGLSVRPEAVFAADQNRIYPLETRTPGYGIINVAGSYTIGRQHFAHIFTFNAYNLTDKLYRNHLSFIKELAPEIGRGVRFGYTVRFF
ncbi:MAG: Outer rane receptor protein mostly Fe transport [Acidobacteria bacterium]|jgi:iron complex outermembrane receptor protein|nr:Outer rane receptor protein mostly Fe transport [Acidobacteriota bacterium]